MARCLMVSCFNLALLLILASAVVASTECRLSEKCGPESSENANLLKNGTAMDDSSGDGEGLSLMQLRASQLNNHTSQVPDCSTCVSANNDGTTNCVWSTKFALPGCVTHEGTGASWCMRCGETWTGGYGQGTHLPNAGCAGYSNQACLLTNCVWGTWTSWGECSQTCGGGEATRSRAVQTPAANGGADCDGENSETKTCNTESCPVDCEWGSWGPWETCSQTCGGGQETRNRLEAIAAANNGAVCVGDPSETQPCNTQSCPVDCQWTAWDAWTACSQTCGPDGVQSRSRSEAVAMENNGELCVGDSSETQPCNTDITCPTDDTSPEATDDTSPEATIYGDPHVIFNMSFTSSKHTA